MPASQKVSIFTTALRSEFDRAYQEVVAPAPFQAYTTVIPSTARIEHYTWMHPVPGMARYQGYRRYAKIDAIKYTVENLEWDSAFEVPKRDVEDDQTGGYMRKPASLAQQAKTLPADAVLDALGDAGTLTCFDGSTFFANSHTIGSGDNLLTRTAQGSSDGATNKLIALYIGNPEVKPLIWQDRKAPELKTTAGTPQSDEAKMLRYFMDMEGAAAFGFWWDAVQITITNTPNVNDMHDCLQDIVTAYRSFYLPQALPETFTQYMHEHTTFSASNLWLIGTPNIEVVLRQALNASSIPQRLLAGQQASAGGTPQTVAVDNIWKGFANYHVSNRIS